MCKGIACFALQLPWKPLGLNSQAPRSFVTTQPTQPGFRGLGFRVLKSRDHESNPSLKLKPAQGLWTKRTLPVRWSGPWQQGDQNRVGSATLQGPLQASSIRAFITTTGFGNVGFTILIMMIMIMRIRIRILTITKFKNNNNTNNNNNNNNANDNENTNL